MGNDGIGSESLRRELVQMQVIPAEQALYDLVKFMERILSRHQHAAPDLRIINVEDAYAELEGHYLFLLGIAAEREDQYGE